MWLVTAYHPNGSLYDYLNHPEETADTIDPRVAAKLVYTAVSGLVHLHTEFHGTKARK